MLNYDTDVRENWKSTILDWSKIRPQTMVFFLNIEIL